MGFVPKICVRCGAMFAVARSSAHAAKYCPDCRKAIAREKSMESYVPKDRVCNVCGATFFCRERGGRRVCDDCRLRGLPNTSPAKAIKKKKQYKSFDEHIKALAKSGTSYAEEQKRETLELFAHVDVSDFVKRER